MQQTQPHRTDCCAEFCCCLAAACLPPHCIAFLKQVIYSAKQSALASSNGWCYAPGCSAAGQSGSGNNWALGHNKFGPAMAPAVLDLVRRQVRW